MNRRTPQITAAFIAILLLSACSGPAPTTPAEPAKAQVSTRTTTPTAHAGGQPISISGSPFLTHGESGAGLLVVNGTDTTFRDADGRNFALIDSSGNPVEKWSTQPSISIMSAVSGSGALVVVGMRATSELDGTTEFMVQSLDAKTGRELWSNDLKSASEVSYGLGDIAGGVVELVTYARENQAAYGGEDGTAYTSLTSHFLDVKTGKERFSFGKCDPRTPGVGAMDGQMVISLEPLITRQGSGTIDDTGRPRPCSHFGAAQVRSLATGNVTGALSEKVLPIEYAPLQTVFGSGKNLVLSVGGQIRAMTPNGVQVWARDASAAQVLDADEEHVVALVRQTHKVVVLDARTGKSVSTIPDVQDDIEIAVLAGPHQFVLAGDSGSSLYSL